ncbi:MAG TPA: hypothetical protein PKI76_05795 [Oscillospiraceae bacterium]|nr:hypothetical protein [Oscillospiraceae bacterium]HNW04878.1 hypothetical protein [Oscillospiraceae bacterium]
MKKPIVDTQKAPGSRLILYGCVFLIISALINAYFAWELAVAVFLGIATVDQVMGSAASFSLQCLLCFLVALDAIMHRNHPSVGRKIMINCFCILLIATALFVTATSAAGYVVSGISGGGAVIVIIGAYYNYKRAANR